MIVRHAHALDPRSLAIAAGLAMLAGMILVSYARLIFGPRRSR